MKTIRGKHPHVWVREFLQGAGYSPEHIYANECMVARAVIRALHEMFDRVRVELVPADILGVFQLKVSIGADILRDEEVFNEVIVDLILEQIRSAAARYMEDLYRAPEASFKQRRSPKDP